MGERSGHSVRNLLDMANSNRTHVSELSCKSEMEKRKIMRAKGRTRTRQMTWWTNEWVAVWGGCIKAGD